MNPTSAQLNSGISQEQGHDILVTLLASHEHWGAPIPFSLPGIHPLVSQQQDDNLKVTFLAGN